jgi:DNA-binding transcriptional MerR regulator
MPVNINGETYYQTHEACEMIGVSRNTLYHLIERTIFRNTERRDYHGWRLFTMEDINQLRSQTNRINLISVK